MFQFNTCSQNRKNGGRDHVDIIGYAKLCGCGRGRIHIKYHTCPVFVFIITMAGIPRFPGNTFAYTRDFLLVHEHNRTAAPFNLKYMG